MKSLTVLAYCSVAAFAWVGTAFAQDESAYTKIDLDKTCKFYSTYEAGGSARCAGFRDYPIYFAEGDLRQMVRFGHVPEEAPRWESFGEFNRINDTVEWRINDGIPHAAILRWFIENTDNETGSVTPETTGQVLVISTVGEPHNSKSCVAGYVDARANPGANEIAREVADTTARNFVCGEDRPKFHGKRGPFSGQPTALDY